MIGGQAGDGGPAGSPRRPAPARVLADRMAATVVHHEPGWRLPRLTALARRYSASVAEVDAAVDELCARHLLRRLPDGHIYRASPAEYRVPLEGVAELTSHVDPMGGQLRCKSRTVSRRRPREDIARALRLRPGEPVLTVKCLWTVGGEPAALSASYLPVPGRAAPPVAGSPADGTAAAGPPAGGTLRPDPDVTQPDPAAPEPAGPDLPGREPAEQDPAGPGPAGSGPSGPDLAVVGQSQLPPTAGRVGQPRALQLELGPPPPSVARSLRLAAGEPAVSVTVRFENHASQVPVALTTAILRPELFRIVIQAAAATESRDSVAGLVSAWTQTVAGWEP